MRKPRLHNKIGRSIFTLPICVLLAIALWWWPRGSSLLDNLLSLLLTLFVAYVLMETNNTNQIIRVRSRMLSSVWLLGMACIGFLHSFQPILLSVLSLSISYYLLFRTYQCTQPVADVFHSFLFLSLGAVVFPPMLYLVPAFLWYLLVFMRTLTFRTLWAAVVGTCLPFWFWMGFLLVKEDLTPLVTWWGSLLGMANLYDWGNFEWADMQDPDALSHQLPFFFFTFLTLWTSVYYLLNSYDDKIRTRMIFYIYVCQSALIVAYAILTFRFEESTPLLLLSFSPLLAHYFTLRTTWGSLVMFVLTILGFAVLALSPFYSYLCTRI